jgi:hypothetical protein
MKKLALLAWWFCRCWWATTRLTIGKAFHSWRRWYSCAIVCRHCFPTLKRRSGLTMSWGPGSFLRRLASGRGYGFRGDQAELAGVLEWVTIGAFIVLVHPADRHIYCARIWLSTIRTRHLRGHQSWPWLCMYFQPSPYCYLSRVLTSLYRRYFGRLLEVLFFFLL